MSVKSLIRLALPAVALLIGYIDLWRGGITLAPLILILGYCVLIPWAIWTWPDGEEPAGATTHRASYGLAVGMGVLVLLLYLITLAPSTAMWDTSEYIAAAYTLGLPHPPGNPLFVLIGRVFCILPIAPTVAARINLLAAICSAVVGRHVVPRSPSACSSGWFAGALAAHRRRRARGAHRRHRVHGLESVGRQREGLHGLAGRASRSSPG